MSAQFVENYERLSLEKTMDCFLSTTIQPALFAVAFLLMVSPTLGLSSGEIPSCNSTSEYRLVNSSSHFKGCYPCDACMKGQEPPILCGTDVLDGVSIGHCKRCRDGTFSAKKDSHPCQRCLDPKCAKHELVICDIETGDNSRCTGNCEEGVWNEGRKECQLSVEPPQVRTTKSPDNPQANTTENPTEYTTSNPDLELHKVNHTYRLSVGLIIVIVIGVLIFVSVPVIGLLYLNKMRQRDIQVVIYEEDNKCVSEDGSTGSVKESMEELGRLIKDASTDSINQSNVCDLDSSIPQTRDTAIQMEMNVRSPAHLIQLEAPAGPVMPPDHFLARPPPTAPPPEAPHRPDIRPYNPDPMHFANLPSWLETEICETFDFGSPGKDSKALADHLKIFSSREVRRFWAVPEKANAIIQSWISIRGNNIPKFVEVLKEMDLTYLAGKLNEYIDQVQQRVQPM